MSFSIFFLLVFVYPADYFFFLDRLGSPPTFDILFLPPDMDLLWKYRLMPPVCYAWIYYLIYFVFDCLLPFVLIVFVFPLLKLYFPLVIPLFIVELLISMSYDVPGVLYSVSFFPVALDFFLAVLRLGVKYFLLLSIFFIRIGLFFFRIAWLSICFQARWLYSASFISFRIVFRTPLEFEVSFLFSLSELFIVRFQSSLIFATSLFVSPELGDVILGLLCDNCTTYL